MHKVRNEKFLIRFGKNLKKARNRKGMSQEDLAAECELALSQIARLETGKLNTSISTVDRLLQALGIEADELFR